MKHDATTFAKRTAPIPGTVYQNTPCLGWHGTWHHTHTGHAPYPRYHGRLAWRVAWELTHGPIPSTKEMQRCCPTMACINEAHYRLVRRGTSQRSTARHNHHHALLTPADVQAIRAAGAAGEGPTTIAARYGRKVNTIADILHQRAWRDVPPDAQP